MARYLLFSCLYISYFLGFSPLTAQEAATYVNPLIGTAGGGGTLPGAVVPWGMVSLSPHMEQRPDGLYDFLGIGHVHISGAGCPGLGHIVFLPTIGTVGPHPDKYRLIYKHWNVAVQAGFYEKYVQELNLRIGTTTTPRAGISQMTFPTTDSACLIIKASEGYSPSRGSFIEFVSPTEVRGWNTSQGFCGGETRRTVYFYMKVSKAPLSYTTWDTTGLLSTKQTGGIGIGALLRFSATDRENILLKTGISYVSMDNAKQNLDTEIPDWDFTRVREEAFTTWNTELSKIAVTGGTKAEKIAFYTALYHTLLYPSVYSDVNGEYPSMKDYSTLKADGYTRYTLFSLWDTFRTTHPLLTLAYPERQIDMMRTIIEQYRESGWMPQWEMPGGETYAMFGDPAGLVLMDSYSKGLRNFDLATAFEGMSKTALASGDSNMVRRGLDAYLRYNYIPIDDRGTPWASAPVATSLEYAYSDWAASQAALALCQPDKWAVLYHHSQNFRNLFDTQSGFFRPRNKDGSWFEPFVPDLADSGDYPEIANSGGPGFAEGSAWHYLFYAYHDMPGLIQLFGGANHFFDKVSSFFDRGYFKWNQHNFSFPYLYTYVDNEAWRAQKLVRQLLHDFDASNGNMPGNDDLGALSAWYVFSAIGFYPVETGTPEYRLGSPLFDSITLHLNPAFYPDTTFTILANGNSADNVFVQSAMLNGHPYRAAMLSHKDITAGGTLELIMNSVPPSEFPASYTPLPIYPVRDTTLTRIPSLQWKNHSFAQQTHLQVMQGNLNCTIVIDTVLPASVTEYRPLQLQPFTRYFWRVESSDSHYTSSWSPMVAFSMDMITAISHTLLSGNYLTVTAHPSYSAGSDIVINYSHSGNRFLSLSIFDGLGREIERLFSGFSPAGTHQYIWQPPVSISNMYFLIVRDEEGNRDVTKVLFAP